VAEVVIFVELDLARLLPRKLYAECVVVGRQQAGEREDLAAGDAGFLDGDGLPVDTDAIAAAERRALALTGVFFKIDDGVQDFFDAGISVMVMMFQFHIASFGSVVSWKAPTILTFCT